MSLFMFWVSLKFSSKCVENGIQITDCLHCNLDETSTYLGIKTAFGLIDILVTGYFLKTEFINSVSD